jgi:hypothetical protein
LDPLHCFGKFIFWLLFKANNKDHRCWLNTDSVKWYWINYGSIRKICADFMFVFPDMHIASNDVSVKYCVNFMACYTNIPRFWLWIFFYLFACETSFRLVIYDLQCCYKFYITHFSSCLFYQVCPLPVYQGFANKILPRKL